jgi:predicted alpha/beta-fold hydrolase
MSTLIPFKPLPFLTSGRWQTILGYLGFPQRPPKSEQINITLDDGDILVCNVSYPKNTPKGLVIMLHGLGGSANSRYMMRISKRCNASGYIAVRVNLRGSGLGQGLARKLHYAGGSADIIPILQTFHEKYPDLPIQILGFSLGGHILLKYLGELGSNAPSYLKNAIAVCPAVEPANAVKRFALPKNRLLQRSYTKGIVKLVRVAEKAFPDLKKTEFPKNLSLYLYDQIYVTATWGFDSAEEYYDLCRASRFIPMIRVPCRILYSLDDPFVDHKTLEDLEPPASVQLFYTEHGGHMGFLGFTGNGWNARWMDNLVLKWIADNNP